MVAEATDDVSERCPVMPGQMAILQPGFNWQFMRQLLNWENTIAVQNACSTHSTRAQFMCLALFSLGVFVLLDCVLLAFLILLLVTAIVAWNVLLPPSGQSPPSLRPLSLPSANVIFKCEDKLRMRVVVEVHWASLSHTDLTFLSPSFLRPLFALPQKYCYSCITLNNHRHLMLLMLLPCGLVDAT